MMNERIAKVAFGQAQGGRNSGTIYQAQPGLSQGQKLAGEVGF